MELWFEDEARVGNKGRLCHLWWRRGERPPGVQQLGYKWAYIFTAIRPATGEDVTLVLPTVNTEAMQVFLDQVAASRPPRNVSTTLRHLVFEFRLGLAPCFWAG